MQYFKYAYKLRIRRKKTKKKREFAYLALSPEFFGNGDYAVVSNMAGDSDSERR